MGISLQLYRITIGTFVPNQIQKKRKSVSRKKSSFLVSCVYILCLLLLNTAFLEPFSLSKIGEKICVQKNKCFAKPNRMPHPSFIGIINNGLVESYDNLKFDTYSGFVTDGNFIARYINGNRIDKGLKIAHWNLGSAHLKNKMHEIETLVADIHPHLLGISESNHFKCQNIESVMLPDYDLITALTLENPNLEVSRIVIYKHKSVVAKIRKDLMSNLFSSIWIEVGLPKKKKILVCHFYREHQYLRQKDLSSLSSAEQLNRWLIFLDQWERALATGKECMVLGDCNIDHLMIGSTELPQYRNKDLLSHLCDRIYPLGVRQCIQGHTHSRPGQRNSLLDVIYTNNPEKLSNVTSIARGESDHKVIFAVRHSKVVFKASRYIKKRSYKNFDEELFCNEVKNISWWPLYQSSDVDMAVKIFTDEICQILDLMAPIKVFQNRKKYVPWLSQATKSSMVIRDNLLSQAKSSGLAEDWNKFKKARNEITGKLRLDKETWKRKSLENCGNDSARMWKSVLGWLNWSNSGTPAKLFANGKLETSPKIMASVMNNYYIDKIKAIRTSLPISNEDPLKKLKIMMTTRKSSFTALPVHPDLIGDVISNLKI